MKMAAKGNKKGSTNGEEHAWQEYLASIGGKPALKKKKGKPVRKALSELFQGIGIGKKEKEAKEAEKQIAITAAEGRKIAAKKQETQEEKRPLGEKIFGKEQKKPGFEKQPKPFAAMAFEKQALEPAEKPKEKKSIVERLFGKKAKKPAEKKPTAATLFGIAEKPGFEKQPKPFAKKPIAKKIFGKVELKPAGKKPAARLLLAEGKKGYVTRPKWLKKKEEKKQKPLGIEKYIKLVEDMRKAELEKAAGKKALPEEKQAKASKRTPAVLAWKRPKKEEKKPAAKKAEKPAKAGPTPAVERAKALLPKKISLMPKAGMDKIARLRKKIALMPKGVEEEEETALKKPAKKRKAKPGRKRKAKPGRKRKARPAKKMAKRQPKAGAVGEELARVIGKRPSLAEKSVAEIKKISPKKIRKALTRERTERKATGWYGEILRHRKAALDGWRIRKRLKLYKLRKKAKKKKLTKKEQKQQRALVADDRQIRKNVVELDGKIQALKMVARQKQKEGKLLEKKAKAAGIKIPKAKTAGFAKGRAMPKKKNDIVDLVGAMKSIANQMATATTKQAMAGASWTDALTMDDQIKAHQKLIKNLERAFYKRKIDFKQFREKMFEYQSKLSEMRIRKKLAEERKAKMSPEMRAALERRLKETRGKAPPASDLMPKVTKSLEKLAKRPAPKEGAGKETLEAIKKLGEKETGREVKEKGEKKFAEKTTEALQRIVERLGKQRAPAGPRQVEPRPGTPAWAPGRREPAKQGAAAGVVPMPPRPMAKPPEPAATKAKIGTVAAPGAVPAQPTPEAARPAPITRLTYEEEYRPKKRKRRGKKPGRRKRPKYREERVPRPAEAPIQRAVPIPGYEEEEYKPMKRKRKPAKRKGLERIRKIIEREETKEAKGKKLEKGIVERIREKVSLEAKPKVGKLVDKAIREKAATAGISKQQIDNMEGKLSSLLKKYNIPENVVASHIQNLGSNRLIQDFQKLIDLIEEKKENAVAELIKPAPGFDIKTGIIAKKREKIVGKEKQIRHARIETTFDRILGLVQVKGIINLNDVAKQLGITRKEAQSCAEILEKSGLIKLRYPPIGSVKLIYPAYLKWAAEQKKKKKGKSKK